MQKRLAFVRQKFDYSIIGVIYFYDVYNIMQSMLLPPFTVVFYRISRIFSMRLWCSKPVEMI